MKTVSTKSFVGSLENHRKILKYLNVDALRKRRVK